jgi:STE24 endopeptidase
MSFRFPRAALAVPLLALLALPAAGHAATGFDVEAATRAWLDTLQGPARARSDSYFEGGYWLILWGTLVSVLADGVLLRFGLSARMRDMAGRVFKGRAGVLWLTAVLYLLWGTLVTFPWAVYTGFIREKQYGLANQDFAGWLGDDLKNTAVSLVVFPLLVMAIYAVIRRFPRNWWIGGTAVVGLFATIGIMLAPVYIAPLFNKYVELPAGPVRDRIVAMAHAKGIPADHIYLFDASKQTKRISANVSGIGPTVRISLNDNLLNRTSLPETAAVVGHEMGHYVLGHTRNGVLGLTAIAALFLFLTARLAPWLIARNGARWGISDVADPASLPVLGILVAVLGMLATPLTNTLVRVQESQADAFGLDVAHEPDGFASIAIKLAEYRKLEPGALEEVLFYDHPSGRTRVRMAMQWKHDHVANPVMVVPPPLPQDAPRKP